MRRREARLATFVLLFRDWLPELVHDANRVGGYLFLCALEMLRPQPHPRRPRQLGVAPSRFVEPPRVMRAEEPLDRTADELVQSEQRVHHRQTLCP